MPGVSTGEQTLGLKFDAFQKAGCEKISTETAGGARAERPALQEVLGHLRTGDVLVV